MVDSADRIIGRVRRRWLAAPDAPCFTILDGTGPTSLTAADMLARTGRCAGALAAHGVSAGDRVGIVLPTSVAFLEAFFGAWWLGAGVVPLAPPMLRQEAVHERHRLTLALGTARVKLAVVTPDVRDLLGPGSVPCATSGDLTGEVVVESPRPPGGFALIQFSSGSTGHPKGVALHDAQIQANIESIRSLVGPSSDDLLVSWLPLYHDMGLVSAVLWSQVVGIASVIMPPETIVLDPASWLKAIARFRGTLSTAPNFAYQLCARVPPSRLDGLDLSAWRIAMVGAEPVRPETLRAFAAKMAPFGFRAGALMPTYGLAEATVGVSARPAGAGMSIDRIERDAYYAAARAVPAEASTDAANCLEIVSVGAAMPGVAIEIRDEAGHPLAERFVGEVWVKSPGVMAGYFEDPEGTAAVLTADGWLRSGDLGYLVGRELHVSGRIKDLIIRGGCKYHPQDLEAVAESYDAVRAGGAAAFVVEAAAADRERVVLLAEVKGGTPVEPELGLRLRGHIHEATGLRIDEVVLVKPYQLPKTSSGKIRRAEARRRFLAGLIVRADG